VESADGSFLYKVLGSGALGSEVEDEDLELSQ